MLRPGVRGTMGGGAAVDHAGSALVVGFLLGFRNLIVRGNRVNAPWLKEPSSGSTPRRVSASSLPMTDQRTCSSTSPPSTRPATASCRKASGSPSRPSRARRAPRPRASAPSEPLSSGCSEHGGPHSGAAHRREPGEVGMMEWPDGVADFRPQESLKAVVAGRGAVEQRLAAVLEAEGVRRPLIVCGSNLATSPAMDTVAAALKEHGFEPLVYAGSRPHTPLESVDAGAVAAREGGADGFIALGGSSAIDCAKGVAVLTFTGKASVKDLQ